MSTTDILLPGLDQTPLASPSLNEITEAANANGILSANYYHVYLGRSDNEYTREGREPDVYGVWDKILESGRDYLVGASIPMDQFIREHRSPLNAWQKVAYAWAKANPTKVLCIENSRYEWTVRVRGEFVELGLPHQDHGGEKHWVSKDGKTKILINVD